MSHVFEQAIQLHKLEVNDIMKQERVTRGSRPHTTPIRTTSNKEGIYKPAYIN